MASDCLEYVVIRRFFHEEHLVTKEVEGEERIKFLKPPSWYGGGRIPNGAYYREENKPLLRFELIPAVDILYAALERVNTLAKTKYDENVGIRLIPKVLHACERRGVPQNHAPGILLLYLEHCEGCQWRHLVPEMLYDKQKSLLRIDRLRKQIERLIIEGRYQEAEVLEDEAKLAPEDWPEYMIAAVADFAKATRRPTPMRVNAQK